MTIIEAIKSGKGFKRPGDVEWHPNGPNAAKRFHIETCILSKNYCDVVADDWEVEEKKIEITARRIREIWDRSFLHAKSDVTYECNLLIKELGLE